MEMQTSWPNFEVGFETDRLLQTALTLTRTLFLTNDMLKFLPGPLRMGRMGQSF